MHGMDQIDSSEESLKNQNVELDKTEERFELNVLNVHDGTTNALPRPSYDQPIEDYDTFGLSPLNHKPFFLQTWVLILTILLNLGWITWLAIAYTDTLWRGPQFILDGIFAGYVATGSKFLIIQQVFNVGKIVPYRNMRQKNGGNVASTICSDYWPYEWPIVRFRAIRNRDYFFQVIDIVAFLFTEAIVQFESNILSPKYDYLNDGPDGPPILGWTPNRGVIIIAIICHSSVVLITLAILIWLQVQETGLLADPGYLAVYLAMFNKEDIQKDFQGYEDEDRPWLVRKRLKHNRYKIGYWRKDDSHAIYGIRREKIPEEEENDERNVPRPRKPTEYPEFRYIPWFLRTHYLIIWVSVLAAALAILSTLLIRDNILFYGFAPHASTAIIPFIDIAPASFLWSFFPSFAADLFHLLVQSIDTFYRLTQPYTDLQLQNADPGVFLKAFEINYINDLPIVIAIRAFHNGHPKVAIISLFSFFASFTTTWAANMFYVQDGWVYIWTNYFYSVLVYMCLLIVFLLWTVPDEKRYMPRDLETIADHMALLSQSGLLDEGKFQRVETFRAPDVSSDPQPSPPTKVSSYLTSLPHVLATSLTTALSSSFGNFKVEGFTKTLTNLKKSAIGPPALVDHVIHHLDTITTKDVHGKRIGGSKKLPRFGVWKDGERYVVGIDRNEGAGTDEEGDMDTDGNGGKIISLFKKRGIRKRWEDLWRGWWDSFV